MQNFSRQESRNLVLLQMLRIFKTPKWSVERRLNYFHCESQCSILILFFGFGVYFFSQFCWCHHELRCSKDDWSNLFFHSGSRFLIYSERKSSLIQVSLWKNIFSFFRKDLLTLAIPSLMCVDCEQMYIKFCPWQISTLCVIDLSKGFDFYSILWYRRHIRHNF